MNYNDWVQTFENRTPEHLTGIINAIDTLERDLDIRRDFDDLGIFAGFSIRSAAREALKKKKKILVRRVTEHIYTMVITRISEEYPIVDPGVITSPITFDKIYQWIDEWVSDNKEESNGSTLDTVGAIIDTVIDDTHLYYPDMISKFLYEAGLDGLESNEAECSILYGESYYSLEDSIIDYLAGAYGGSRSPGREKKERANRTHHYWTCQCRERDVHPKYSVTECTICLAVESSSLSSTYEEVVNAKLMGWL